MHGVESLSDVELLAVLLGTGTQQQPVGELAASLLARSDLRELARRGVGSLAEQSGVGSAKAARLAAAFELGRRAWAVREPDDTFAMRSPQNVVDLLAPELAIREWETFVVLALDVKNRVRQRATFTAGSPEHCPVRPGDVLRFVLRAGATSLVVAHNHPSGDPTPSAEDVSFTAALARASELVAVRLVDHIVISATKHYSFEEHGLLATESAFPTRMRSGNRSTNPHRTGGK